LVDNGPQLLEKAVAEYRSNPAEFEAFIAKVRTEASKPLAEGEALPAAMAPHAAASAPVEDISAQICLEMTLLRANPPAYAQHLQAHLENYTSDDVYKASGGTLIKTKEGKAAVQEVIDELRGTDPLPEVQADAFLFKAARDHAADLATEGFLGHTGSDGSSTKVRIERHCQWTGTIGENIDYGNTDARDIVMHLLIDDGVPSRGHRKNLLNSGFLVAGAALGAHTTYRHACVVKLAGGTKVWWTVHDTLAYSPPPRCFLCALTPPHPHHPHFLSPKSFDDICRDDVNITVGSYEEMHLLEKPLNSIPGDTSALSTEIEAELGRGCKVTLMFKPSASEAVVEFQDSKSIRTMKMSWAQPAPA